MSEGEAEAQDKSREAGRRVSRTIPQILLLSARLTRFFLKGIVLGGS